MRHFILCLCSLLLLPVLAFAHETTLYPGAYLISGDPGDISVADAVPSGEVYRTRGIRIGDFRLRPLVTQLDKVIHIGSAISIRGRKFTPVVVAPSVSSLNIRTAKNLDAKDDSLSFPKKLAIITHSSYVAALHNLDNFISVKEDKGWDVVVITEESWNPGDLVGSPAADALRQWLAANYESEGIGFVLLAGNPHPETGNVPMKMTWPLRGAFWHGMIDLWREISVPTDYYYADLEGNWDLDGDGDFGEYPDDAQEGGMDLGPEVIVGRFPVYSDTSVLDAYFLQAAQYETKTDLTGRNRVLLPGAMLVFNGMDGDPYSQNQDGGTVLNAIGENLAALDPSLEFTRLFEQEGHFSSPLPMDAALTTENLLSAFNDGYGLGVWFAHGSETDTGRLIWTSDANGNDSCDENEMADILLMSSSFTNQIMQPVSRTFLWQISCSNATPEVEDNLAAMMLRSSSAATIAATRSSFGEEWEGISFTPDPALAASETQAYYWAQKMAEGLTMGEAFAYTIYAVPSDGWDEVFPPDQMGFSFMGMRYYGKFVYNLYGDPTLTWQYSASVDDDDNDDSASDDDSDDDDTDDGDPVDDDDDDDEGACGCK